MKKIVVLFFSAFLLILASRFAHAVRVEEGYAVEELAENEHLTFGNIPTILQLRNVIDIPEEYGKLIGIYPVAGTIALFFESGDGQIRNVTLQSNDASRPFSIHRSGKVE